jgi:hypothetical protein
LVEQKVKNPVEILKKIGTKILRDDKYRFLKTGEELPDVIKSLLGQEKKFKNISIAYNYRCCRFINYKNYV